MNPEPDRGWAARYRSLVVAGVLVAAVVLTALIAGRPGHQAGGGRPRVSFGAQVKRLAATADLVYTNGWVATSGNRRIGVYAGSARSQRDSGLLVIVRQAAAGRPRISRVTVHRSGALTLLRPASPATESAAFSTILHLVAASGATGTLDLGNDRVELSP